MQRARPITAALVGALLLCTLGVVHAQADDPSITAWKTWKPIDAAVALRPLDGPDDILEKVEIVEDRIDRLNREKERIDRILEERRNGLESLRRQREALQDLAEMQAGGDAQTSERLRDLAERIRSDETFVARGRESLTELVREQGRLKNLADEYREKARKLSQEEGGGA